MVFYIANREFATVQAPSSYAQMRSQVFIHTKTGFRDYITRQYGCKNRTFIATSAFSCQAVIIQSKKESASWKACLIVPSYLAIMEVREITPAAQACPGTYSNYRYRQQIYYMTITAHIF